jgi:inositol-pentakisphosphate 2-kinase
LRKDLPTTIPVAINQRAWERVIAPLFDRDQVVEQRLVRLESGTISFLNNELREWDEKSQHFDPEEALVGSIRLPRPVKRRGTYLADDEFGLFVTDMRAGR